MRRRDHRARRSRTRQILRQGPPPKSQRSRRTIPSMPLAAGQAMSARSTSARSGSSASERCARARRAQARHDRARRLEHDRSASPASRCSRPPANRARSTCARSRLRTPFPKTRCAAPATSASRYLSDRASASAAATSRARGCRWAATAGCFVRRRRGQRPPRRPRGDLRGRHARGSRRLAQRRRSPQYFRISARTRSRSRTAAFQSLPSGAIGAPKVTAIGERRGNQVPSRSTERTPRSATGTTGMPACAATWNAPVRNGSRPGRRSSVPSGKMASDSPCLRRHRQLVGVLGALLHVEALDEHRAEALEQGAHHPVVRRTRAWR